MARVNSLPFRLLCKDYGASLTCSEMVNANALCRNNRSMHEKIKTTTQEKPFSVQLFGSRNEILCKAANMLDCNIVDVNLGCPDLDIIKQGSGSALLKRPQKIKTLISDLVKRTDKPITAKIRISRKIEESIKIAKIVESSGGAAIAVHGRTVSQKYSGTADWNAIGKIKESVSIPVIASGDIKDGLSAKECLKKTNADYLMIGRAAMGNPYVFKSIKTYLDTGNTINQKPRDKLKDFFGYIEYGKKFNSLKYSEVKTHAIWFTKGLPGLKSIRAKISGLKNIEEIVELIASIKL